MSKEQLKDGWGMTPAMHQAWQDAEDLELTPEQAARIPKRQLSPELKQAMRDKMVQAREQDRQQMAERNQATDQA